MHADAPEEKSIPLDILKEAMATIIVRGEHYGDSDSNLQFIASLWTTYLEKTISCKDVALMMVLLKIARAKYPKYLKDNYVDVCGYAALAANQDEQGK
jgi:hypothetical protein|tara:strand:- start:6953 stop:7246 length:294 start_codon:yes stop_codon:yes gene_type:complete